MQDEPIALAGQVADVSDVGDFWRLLKPNVMSLVLFSAAVGLYLAPGELHPVLILVALLCIAAGAGASAAINNSYDADIDRIMPRTRRRPTATGRIKPADALAFGVTTAVLSIMVMGLAVNWTAAALLALTIGFYVLVYTMWLKRRTPQNIVIGGAAGALPPMIGWAAATGEVGWPSIVMFLIIFFWTPPHFWALALYRTEDYARAAVPMLPVVAGQEATRQQILAYTVILLLVSLLPTLLGQAGLAYGLAALGLGGTFVAYAWRLWHDRSQRTANRTFRFSLLYLFALFGALVADHMATLLVPANRALAGIAGGLPW
jgi:protoheme IX farnesyltransferase